MSIPPPLVPPTTILTLLLVAGTASAEPTLELFIRGAKEVFEGDPVSTTVDADGRIGLGLTEALLTEGPGRPAVAIVQSRRGLLVGTAGAGLLRIRRGAKAEVLEGAKGLVVSALAADDEGAWFATGPDGQIARWDGREVAPWFDPKPAYVWSLLADGDAVLAATGAPGQLLRVGKGSAETLFASEETHLRALVRHPTRGLVVGGGEKGVVYQLVGDGKVRALYDSDLEEVTAFAVDPATGDLFAAVVSASKKGALDPGTWIGRVGDEKEDEASPIKGSEVVRIRASGEVDRLWSSKDEGALGLSFDPERRRVHLVTGTGPKKQGRVYALDLTDRNRVILLARLPPPLATAVVTDSDGGLLVATAPDGAVFRLGPRTRADGTYLSVEQDLRRVARVGRLWFDADVPAGGRLEVSLRTGNTERPDATWSDWSAAVSDPSGGRVEVPAARYAQFRARLVRGDRNEGPHLRSMHASVRRANLPPEVREVYPLRRGIYLKPIPPDQETEKTVSLTSSVLESLRKPDAPDEGRLRVRAGVEAGRLTIAWRARDPNGDDLLFSADLETPGGRTVELGRDLEVPFVTLDARAFPDGRYRVRVRATDRPGNAPSEALEDVARSEFFVIDNTPPELSKLSARRVKGGLQIEARARDLGSRLAEAEVSVGGGPWLHFPPVDGLIDGPIEDFLLLLSPEQAPDPGTPIRIRTEDEAGNRVTANVPS